MGFGVRQFEALTLQHNLRCGTYIYMSLLVVQGVGSVLKLPPGLWAMRLLCACACRSVGLSPSACHRKSFPALSMLAGPVIVHELCVFEAHHD